jgi:hypothetical protein
VNGATSAEVEFLRGEPVYRQAGGRYKGRRVELNAFTSEAFVSWLESKLTEHQVSKVIPDQATLERAYRRAAGIRRYRGILTRAVEEVEAYSANIQAPSNLEQRISSELARGPSLSWDEVVGLLVASDALGETHL